MVHRDWLKSDQIRIQDPLQAFFSHAQSVRDDGDAEDTKKRCEGVAGESLRDKRLAKAIANSSLLQYVNVGNGWW